MEQKTTEAPRDRHFKWLIIAIIILMAATIIIQRNMDYGNSSPGSNAILHLTEKNFSMQTSEGIVMVDFWATWCKPCVAMEPVLEEIATQYKGKVKVCKVDVDQNRQLSNASNIQVLPTLLIFVNGKEEARYFGIQEKDVITGKLNEIIEGNMQNK